MMLLVHKDISHMPITELENNSESVWVKVFANKTSHYVASWYRRPGGTSEAVLSVLWLSGLLFTSNCDHFLDAQGQLTP